MKKTVFFIIIAIIAISSVIVASQPRNFIKEKAWTTDKFLADSLDSDQMYRSFEYVIRDSYEYLHVWYEIYQDGELKESNGSSSWIDGKNNKKGSFSSMVNLRTGVAHSTFLNKSLSSSSDSGINTTIHSEEDRGGISFYKTLSTRSIREDEEIALFVYASSDKDGPHEVFSLQELMHNPNKAKSYSYVYLLKCQFSNKDTIDKF